MQPLQLRIIFQRSSKCYGASIQTTTQRSAKHRRMQDTLLPGKTTTLQSRQHLYSPRLKLNDMWRRKSDKGHIEDTLTVYLRNTNINEKQSVPNTQPRATAPQMPSAGESDTKKKDIHNLEELKGRRAPEGKLTSLVLTLENRSTYAVRRIETRVSTFFGRSFTAKTNARLTTSMYFTIRNKCPGMCPRCSTVTKIPRQTPRHAHEHDSQVPATLIKRPPFFSWQEQRTRVESSYDIAYKSSVAGT